MFFNPKNIQAERIIFFHEYLMIFITGIFAFVCVLILFALVKRARTWVEIRKSEFLTHGGNLEIVWTLVPVLLLTFIMFPSFSVLYINDEVTYFSKIAKVVGHQWYWTYEDKDEEIASVIVPNDLLEKGQRRLLTVDEVLEIETGVVYRVAITADDVIHSFSLPALGIKTECCTRTVKRR